MRPGIRPTVKRTLERALLASRWLPAPFYCALALGLLALLGKAGQRVFDLAAGFQSVSEAGTMLGALVIIDLTLVGIVTPSRACGRFGRLASQGDAEDQLRRMPIPAGDHSTGDLALSPVRLELSRCRGFVGGTRDCGLV
jgi:hypothetical protein